MYKINILVVTYKQEKVIGRALDSVLSQRQFGLNKIIICDDCSPDNNWSVIKEYEKKYPEYIVAYRNKKNLGIYGNFQHLVSVKGNADLYSFLSGDDAYCDGWLEAIQKCCIDNSLDCSNSFCILGDWKSISPTGQEHVYSQAVVKNANALSLYIRLKLCGRSNVLSKELISRFGPIELGKGLNLAETMFDIQNHLYSDRSYYIPVVGSIYYTEIGISTVLTDEYKVNESLIKWQYLNDYIVKDRSDRCYILYQINRRLFIKEKKYSYLIKAIVNRLLSIRCDSFDFSRLRSDLKGVVVLAFKKKNTKC